MGQNEEVGNLKAKISLDSVGFQDGISSINRQLKVVQSEFQAASAKIGGFGNSTEQLKLKADSLTKQIELQKQKVETLNNAFNKSAETKGADATATQNLEIKLNKARTALANMENDLSKTTGELGKQGTSLNKLSVDTQVASQKMSSSFNDIKTAVLGLGVVVTESAGLYKLAKSAIESGDKLYELSERLNVSTQEASQLNRMLSLADVDSQSFITTLTRLDKSIETAGTSGNDTTKALKEFGINMKDNSGNLVSLNNQLDQLAIGYQNAAKAGKEEEYSAQVLGSRGQALIPLLIKYSEYKEQASKIKGVGIDPEEAHETEMALKTMGLQASQVGKAFGWALVPEIKLTSEALTYASGAMSDFSKNHKELISVVVSTGVSFTTSIAAWTALQVVLKALGTSLKELGSSFVALATNPWILGITAVAAAFAYVSNEINKAKQAQEDYTKAVEKYNKVKQDGIDKSQVSEYEKDYEQLKKIIPQFDILAQKYRDVKKEGQSFAEYMKYSHAFDSDDRAELREAEKQTGISADELTESFNKLGIKIDYANGTMNEAKKHLDTLNLAILDAKRVTADEYNEQAKSLAQKQVTIRETQNLINTYKSAEKGSNEWKTAQQKLAEQFPQFSKASGIEIEAIDKTNKAKDAAVKADWTMLQAKIAMSAIELKNLITLEEAKYKAAKQEQELSETIAKIADPFGNLKSSAGMPDFMKNDPNRSQLDAMKKDLEALNQFKGMSLDDILGVSPGDYGDSSTSSYENKALESALKIHDHKVRMSQMTKEQEIADLEEIKKKYARTSDEIMDMDERIFDAKKENNAKILQSEENALKERTDFSKKWIEDQKKNNPEFGAKEEEAAYQRIINYHKEYLEKILADEKVSAEDKKRIRDQEEADIKEYNDKIAEIESERLNKAKDEINSLNSRIKSALRERYQEEEKAQETALDNEMKSWDKWKETTEKSINDVYNAKIKAIEDAADAQVKALESERDALDEQSKQDDRAAQDQSELTAIKRIQDKIDFEHNEFNKAELQKQLNNLISQRNKRLQDQALSDKKDNLNKQIDAVKDNADKQKELLQQEQQAQIDSMNAVYEAQKEYIQKQKDDWNTFYANKLKDANLEAESEKLIMDNNQKAIVELLHSYENDYEVAGQSLGEKLVAGFKPKIDEIKGMIAEITAQISSARESALSAISLANQAASSNIPSNNKSTSSSEDKKSTTTNSYTFTYNSPTTLTPSQQNAKVESMLRVAAFTV